MYSLVSQPRLVVKGIWYILVHTDYFTKWAYAFFQPDAEASTCMRVMYDGFFAEFGLPRQ